MISIIIPCYNVEKYIDQCIRSIIDQTIGFSNIELILIDDASTDSTHEKLKQYESQYSDNIILIPFEENQRQGTARNVGMQYASGEYISFVDSDDWIEPDMYEKVLASYDDEEYDYVSFQSFRNFDDGSSFKVNKKLESGIYCNIPSTINGGEWWDYSPGGGVWARLFSKKFLVENHILFPERLKYEDNYFGDIASLYTEKIKVLDDYLYHYRENDASTTQKRNDYSQFDRLIIEEMKLYKYKELGLFDKFYFRIEKSFFRLYYFNTLYLMAVRFDNPPYEVFEHMKLTIDRWFPEFRKDRELLIADNSLYEVLIDMLDTNFDRESFNGFMKKYASLPR